MNCPSTLASFDTTEGTVYPTDMGIRPCQTRVTSLMLPGSHDSTLASKLVARSDSEVRGGVIVMPPADAPAGPRRAQGRATDRRRGAGDLLRTVTSGLRATRDVARVRERFEEEVRTLVRARSIVVCDGALAAPPEPSVLCVDIPAEVSPQRPRIEAIFDPGRSLVGWTC